MIHCKICGEDHAGTICTKFLGSSPRASIVVKVKDIVSRPAVLGTKGKAKKAKVAKKTRTKK